MGEIFQCLDDSGRTVALKKILPQHQEDEKFRDLFMREAEITFCLDHPNIVRAYGFEKVGQQLVLALEFLEGVNLKQVLRQVYEKKLVIPLVVAVEIIRNVLRGLDHAHKKRDRKGKSLGIIHRDLNPSNIFVTYAGEVKILDFGISKATEKEVHNLTPKGELRGKMCYLSPEQISQSELDRRSDIFSVGIVMWEMITGQPLFLRDSNTEVLEAIQRAEYRPASQFRNDIPPEFDELLKKALSREPQDRFNDCLEFAVELTKVAKKCLLPSTGADDISVFVRSIFLTNADYTDPQFISGYAWLLTQIQGQEQAGLDIAQKVAREYASSPYVNLMLAKSLLAAGKKPEGLRLLKKLSRVDSLEETTQEMLEWLGVRRKPMITFLKRSNLLNRALGRIRHRFLGPTPFQNDFLAA